MLIARNGLTTWSLVFDRNDSSLFVERAIDKMPDVDSRHTLNCNAGSISVMLCGMGGKDVRQMPLNAGKWPITRAEWEMLPKVLADLCRRYSINMTPETVLSHAEVQGTLGIKQKGKWDIAVLPFDSSLNTAKKVGDAFRAATRALL